MDFDGDEPPAWRTVHGIGRPWHPTPAARRGCVVALWLALALIVVAILVAVVLSVD